MPGRLLHSMAAFSLMGTKSWGPAHAQETNDPSTSPPENKAEKKVDLLLSGHLIGLFPQDKDLSAGGNRIPNTNVRGTLGAGIKFDIYPWFTNKVLGGEIETFGFGGSVRASKTTSGIGTSQAQGSLVAISTMYNLMLRYPGVTIQPYVGIGAGSNRGGPSARGLAAPAGLPEGGHRDHVPDPDWHHSPGAGRALGVEAPCRDRPASGDRAMPG